MNAIRTEPFRTCIQPGTGELRQKGSRFLAFVEGCQDRDSAEARIAAFGTEYRDATHVCWAWRLLSEPDPGEAASDAGEPSGTAGVPMLGALQSSELRNVLGVVVRWYGGTKLGRGGLVRAYRQALDLAVQHARIEEVVPQVHVVVEAPVARLGEVHRVLSAREPRYGEQTVSGQSVQIAVTVDARDLVRLREDLARATHGEGSLSLKKETTE